MVLPVSVCLSVCLLDCSKSYEWIMTKFMEGWWRGPRTNGLEFGGNPDRHLDPGIFQEYTARLKKCPSGQNAISRQLTEIFLPNFQYIQRKEFSTVPKNFTEKFSLPQELQLLQYFVLYLKIVPKK